MHVKCAMATSFFSPLINFYRSSVLHGSDTPRLFKIVKYPLKYENLRLLLVEFMNFPWKFMSQLQF